MPPPGAGPSCAEPASGGGAEEGRQGVDGSASAPSLEQLARHLERAVGSAGAGRLADGRQQPVAPVALGALGFVPCCLAGGGPGGWVRDRRFTLGHRVGQAPVGPAATVDVHMLGLLGLTPALSGCPPDGALYVDVETTGFGGAGTIAFLVGMAWIEEQPDAPSEHAASRVRLEQWLVDSPAYEGLVLEQIRARIAAAAFVVSYNGKAFDLPLLQSRLVMNGLEPFAERPHLDLLHLVRRVHRHRRWRKTLGATERHVLEFDRGADVAGADVAGCYHHYLRTGDAAGLEPVVRHNELDVLTLVALVGLYGEPLERLATEELSAIARTIARAGEPEHAARIASEAVARGGGPTALRARAELAKARGDKGLALGDFDRLASEVDDPRVRLELAKLYEHHVRDPLRALGFAAAGTGEDASALARRVDRLRRKIQRA